MRILQIIPSLGSGGAERFVVDLCNEMAAKGADVHLCLIQNPDERDFGFYLSELNAEVTFTSLNQPKGFRWKNIILLMRLIHTVKPDVIHGHLGVLLYFYFIKLFTLKTKIFFTIHNLAERACPNLLSKILNYLYFKLGLIRVITISKECTQSYHRFYGLKNSNQILNGRLKVLATREYTSVEKEISILKKSSEDLVFVHVARYHDQKNQELLIRVFNRLYSENEKFILLILGDWSFCDEAVRLAQTAEKCIHFLGTKTNVGDYLYLSDAFCLTSVYEGLPISLLEAISCGCVPVCTPVGGITEVVRHEVTGFLSDDVSEPAYYATMKNFMNNRDLIKKETLIQLFDNQYSIEISAKNHLQLFDRSLNKNR